VDCDHGTDIELIRLGNAGGPGLGKDPIGSRQTSPCFMLVGLLCDLEVAGEGTRIQSIS
jgi:hypothetical protein